MQCPTHTFSTGGQGKVICDPRVSMDAIFRPA